MNIQTPVKRETQKIAVGVLILSVIMIIVFIAIKRFDMTVLWGTLLGGGFAVLNFFLMALTVQHAAEQMNGVTLPPEESVGEEEAQGEQPQKQEGFPQQKKIRGIVQKSYLLRMVLMAVVAVAAVKLPVFNAIPAIIALFFPRIVITVLPMIQKNQKGE